MIERGRPQIPERERERHTLGDNEHKSESFYVMRYIYKLYITIRRMIIIILRVAEANGFSTLTASHACHVPLPACIQNPRHKHLDSRCWVPRYLDFLDSKRRVCAAASGLRGRTAGPDPTVVRIVTGNILGQVSGEQRSGRYIDTVFSVAVIECQGVVVFKDRPGLSQGAGLLSRLGSLEHDYMRPFQHGRTTHGVVFEGRTV